jgi:hypothetical protein
MRTYVDGEPHLGISARLDHYCDEATFVDWEQASPDLPDWQTSWRHLTADGKAAELTHSSAANQTRDFRRQSSHLPASPEAASAKSRNPLAGADCGGRGVLSGPPSDHSGHPVRRTVPEGKPQRPRTD